MNDDAGSAPSKDVVPFLAFDLETARVVADFPKWRLSRPLGICCAGTLDERGDLHLWYSLEPNAAAALQMTRPDAASLLQYLAEQQRTGRRVVTWNGAAFDFDVLAEESSNFDLAVQVASDHVDLMVVFGCISGHPLGLARAALACGTTKGAAGVKDGTEPPVLWALGEHERVLSYLAQDVRAPAGIVQYLMRNRGFTWRSASGADVQFQLPDHVKSLDDMTVAKALSWPMPTVSWGRPYFDRAGTLGWTRR